MFDLSVIKSLPIADVARRYGMTLEQRNGRLWGKLRNEKTASFSINISKNLWYDFGTNKGGSVIDLVMEIEGIDKTAAINRLAEDFNIKNEVTKGWHPLTDSQYRELGLVPERVTLNFNYDLRKHTEEQLARWNKKYSIHIRDLVEKEPQTYNKLVMKFGSEQIEIMRKAYFEKIKMVLDKNTLPESKAMYKQWAEIDAAEIKEKVDLLTRGYKGENTAIKSLCVDVSKDLKNYELSKQEKHITEETQLKEKIIKVYKEQYNFHQIRYINDNQAKDIQSLNVALKGTEDNYMSIEEIKTLYKLLGNSLQEYEESLSKTSLEGNSLRPNTPEHSRWLEKMQNIEKSVLETRDFFFACSKVIDCFREITVKHKNDIAKEQKNSQNFMKKDIEISR